MGSSASSGGLCTQSREIKNIPKKMKRWVLVKPHKDIMQAKVEVEEVDVPTPQKGEVLIRVSASPVNPSDYGEVVARSAWQE